VNLNPSAYGLERFVEAQVRDYDSVLDELALGHKTTHWMWFIFPQLKALGRSSMAKHFGIESMDEALAYLQHPILGCRLVECTNPLALMETDPPVLTGIDPVTMAGGRTVG